MALGCEINVILTQHITKIEAENKKLNLKADSLEENFTELSLKTQTLCSYFEFKINSLERDLFHTKVQSDNRHDVKEIRTVSQQSLFPNNFSETHLNLAQSKHSKPDYSHLHRAPSHQHHLYPSQVPLGQPFQPLEIRGFLHDIPRPQLHISTADSHQHLHAPILNQGTVTEAVSVHQSLDQLPPDNELLDQPIIHQSIQSPLKYTDLTCKECDKDFSCILSLLQHTQEGHEITQPQTCYKCDITFTNHSQLKYHTDAEHGSNTEEKVRSETSGINDTLGDETDEDILQCDGNATIGIQANDVTELHNYTGSSVPILQAQYTLNQAKQLSGLSKDSIKDDFSIDVTNDTNINIWCSTGFYEAVGKRAFSTINKGYQTVIDKVSICCDDVRLKKDQLGSLDNCVFWFKVGIKGEQNATIHLHNTRRMIQVQGAAAFWFVEHVLKERFSNEAKNKKQGCPELCHNH